MGAGAGLYMCDVVKKKFTFAISSPDEFLFWLSIGCMIASDDTVWGGGWVFGVKLSDEDIAEIERLRVVAMATTFGTKIVW